LKIPFVDLKANYLSIKTEIDSALLKVIGEASFIKGAELDEFEKNWASACNARHCAGMSNGTSSLEMILKAMNIGTGDEVIMPSHTFIATAESAVNCGARPVFVDCLPGTALIDAKKVSEAVNSRTKAVIIVDLYGQPADHDSVKEALAGKNIRIIQDAAQSHIARYKDQVTGSYCEVTSFSFYPGKNLGAYGDAGAAVTNDDELYKKIKMLSDHGRTTKYEHEYSGTNARMDNIQAAVLNVKLQHVREWNEKRKEAAAKYKRSLKGIVEFIETDKNCDPVYHLLVARVPDRDRLISFLAGKGVSTGIHYPIPLHLQPAFKDLGYKKGDLPVCEKLAGEILSLPIFPEITEDQIEYTVQSIKEYYK
jgi:dTDP-4-amino-4,6-dideoxygalactose transaminase